MSCVPVSTRYTRNIYKHSSLERMFADLMYTYRYLLVYDLFVRMRKLIHRPWKTLALQYLGYNINEYWLALFSCVDNIEFIEIEK